MNNEPQTEMTGYPYGIKKKIEVAKGVAGFATKNIYSIIHEREGYRFASPLILAANTAGLCLLPVFCPEMAKPMPFLMPAFGIASLVCGIIQRKARWAELLRGKIWHSFSCGTPYIERLKFWPEYLLNENRLVRWAEPLLVLLIGAVCAWLLSRALGVYLCVVAAFMWVFQEAVYEEAINTLFDLLDGIIISEAQSRNLAYYNNPNPTTRPPSMKELEGTIATGLTPQLLDTIKTRRAKKVNPPDNLARA